MDLVELIGTRIAPPPNSLFMATVSTASLRGVDVPCALM